MKTHFQSMTSTEIRQARQNGATVLVPIGSTEGNGPHLPVGFDAMLATALAQHAAPAANALWTDPLSYGASDDVAGLDGTIWLEAELITSQLEAVIGALVQDGFDHVVLVANHQPNLYPAELACRRFRRNKGVLVPTFFVAGSAKRAFVSAFSEATGELGHGGEPGTSLMLHLYPETVRMDLVNPAPQVSTFQGMPYVKGPSVNFGADNVAMPVDLVELSPDGAFAAPAGASADRGQRVFDHMVNDLVTFIQQFASIDTRHREDPR